MSEIPEERARRLVEEWEKEKVGGRILYTDELNDLVRRLVPVFARAEQWDHAKTYCSGDFPCEVDTEEQRDRAERAEIARDDLRLNFNRLLSGDYRALSPEWQPIFDRLRDAEATVSRLREALNEACEIIEALGLQPGTHVENQLAALRSVLSESKI